MKNTNVILRKWNQDTNKYDVIECDTLSRAMLLIQESCLYEIVVSDTDSTGELIICCPSAAPEVVCYNN